VATNLGMAAVSLPGGEIVPALERRVIDAAECAADLGGIGLVVAEVHVGSACPWARWPQGLVRAFRPPRAGGNPLPRMTRRHRAEH
jgi:hypothetical protein